MKVTKINIDGTMTDINVSLNKTNILKILEKNSTSKGSTNFSELYNWNHENKVISCYGWYDGDAGFENKHNLMPGSSTFCDEDIKKLYLICLYCVSTKRVKNMKITVL